MASLLLFDEKMRVRIPSIKLIVVLFNDRIKAIYFILLVIDCRILYIGVELFLY
jgi:hypothetical protein